MYLPKSKIKPGGKINGSLIDPKTGLNYVGKFIQDFLGRFYKGSEITKDTQQLEFIPSSEVAEAGNYEGAVEHKYAQPTEKDYAKGSFARYFVKDSRDGRIVEQDETGYKLHKKERKPYRRVLLIEWYITGSAEDQIMKGYLYPGTKSKNADVIKQAEEILPGISAQILKDPGQFVK